MRIIAVYTASVKLIIEKNPFGHPCKLGLVDVFDEAVEGPLMSDQDYYLKRYLPTLTKVIQKHKVKYMPDIPPLKTFS